MSEAKTTAPRAPATATATTPVIDAFAVGIAVIASLAMFMTRRVPEMIVGAFRSIGDDTGPDGVVVYAVTAFAVVVTIGWIAKRRGKERAWPVVALAPAIVFITWIAGAHKLQIAAFKSTPQHTLGERVSELLLANALGADVWLFGGFLAVMVLVAVSLVFGYRARARSEERIIDARRIAILALGFGVAIGVFMLLGTMSHFGPQSAHGARLKAFIALPPSVFGVAAIFIGAGALRHGPRADVSRDIMGSATAACFGVLLCTPILMIGDSADLSGNEIGPEQLVPIFKELAIETRWWAIYTLPFLAPIIVAALVALVAVGRRAYSPPAPPMIVVAAGILSVLLLFAAYGRLTRAIDEVVALPHSIVSTSAPIVVGSDAACRMLPEARLVHVSATRVSTKSQGIDVPFAADGTCADAVRAIDELGKTDPVWLTVDPDAPFGNVSCIFDELARIRPSRIVQRPPAQQSTPSMGRPSSFRFMDSARYTPPAPMHSFSGCDVWLAGTGKDGNPTCKLVGLSDRRCDYYFTFENEDERTFEVIVSSNDSPSGLPIVRWSQGGTLVSERMVTTKDKLVLVDILREEWKLNGSHRDPADKKFDNVALRALPTTPFRDVEQELARLDTITRSVTVFGRPVDVPALRNVTFASLGFPRMVVTDSMLPRFTVGIDASVAEKAKAREAYDVARRMCRYGGCSARVHAQLEWAEIATSTKSLETDEELRRSAVWALARAQILDPSMPMPKLDLKKPLPPLRVESSVDIKVINTDGIDDATMESFLHGLHPDLLDCTMPSFFLGRERDIVDADIKLDVTKTGRVAGGRQISPPGQSGVVNCVILKSKARALSPRPSSPLLRAAEPVLRIHVVMPQL